MKKFILWAILIIGIAISFSAGIYSVTGMMLVFSGSAFAVAILIGSIEIGKLVLASALKVYWDKFPNTTFHFILKWYLAIAVAVVMMLTSAGIYGYLSSAFQATKDVLVQSQKRVELLQKKKETFVLTEQVIMLKINQENI